MSNSLALIQSVILLNAIAVAIVWGVWPGLSLLVGAQIQVMPQFWYLHQVLKHVKMNSSRLSLSYVYSSQAKKFILTMALFAIAFTTIDQWNYPVFFVAFIAIIPLQFMINRKVLSQ